MNLCSLLVLIVVDAYSYVGLDPRRKNATRESTSTLKAWLYEHIKNPYPTKGEKIMLAIITKMTLTQVQASLSHLPAPLKVKFGKSIADCSTYLSELKVKQSCS